MSENLDHFPPLAAAGGGEWWRMVARGLAIASLRLYYKRNAYLSGATMRRVISAGGGLSRVGATMRRPCADHWRRVVASGGGWFGVRCAEGRGRAHLGVIGRRLAIAWHRWHGGKRGGVRPLAGCVRACSGGCSGGCATEGDLV